jgi:hypothetical protein
MLLDWEVMQHAHIRTFGQVLAKMGQPASEALRRLAYLRDRSPDTRRWAVYALGHLGVHAAPFAGGW